jgi:starch-binding outer membrane protein, SusD/RagB family
MKKLLQDSKIITALFLIVFVFSSCQKWLDIVPEKNLIKDNFWKKTEDANSALAATYASLRDASLASFIWGEVRADIVRFPASGNTANYGYIGNSNIDPHNSVIIWSNYYATINLANTLIYYENDVLANDKSFTPKMRDGIESEARFLRSLSYFYLVRLWKNVPLVTRPSISDTCDIYPVLDPDKGIGSEKQIIDFIVSDLVKAKELAYTTEFKTNLKYFKGRANRYSILALLADVYLWSEQYQKCIDCCKEIEDCGFYSLISDPDPSKWFTIYNPGNSDEGIFELQFLDDGSTNQVNPMYIFNGSINGILINLGGNIAFTYNNLPAVFPDALDLRNSKAPDFKYKGVAYNSTLSRSGSSQRDAHIIYYRYADILLMKAEALNELGDLAGAQNYVTKTAERAGLQPITSVTDQNEMRKVILDERAKEFILEGKRWFDLLRNAKRNNFQNKNQLGKLLVNLAPLQSQAILSSKINDEMMYFLPVPYNELQHNKNLKQNPFYLR